MYKLGIKMTDSSLVLESELSYSLLKILRQMFPNFFSVRFALLYPAGFCPQGPHPSKAQFIRSPTCSHIFSTLVLMSPEGPRLTLQLLNLVLSSSSSRFLEHLKIFFSPCFQYRLSKIDRSNSPINRLKINCQMIRKFSHPRWRGQILLGENFFLIN